MNEPGAASLDETVLAALSDSVGGDEAFVADLVETYLADAETQLVAIEAAVADDDAAALVRPAHTLKSASNTLGALRLGELCRSLEQRGRTGQLDGAPADAAAARTEWGSVRTALEAWLKRDGTAS